MTRVSLLLHALVVLAGCSRPEQREFEIETVRVVDREVELGLNLVQRFGSRPRGGGNATDDDSVQLDYALPEGWQVRPASRFVMTSFDVPGDAYCSVSRTGGSLLDNVNRWRRQFGHEPIDAETLSTLTERAIGASTGRLVELVGPFEDRRGKIADAKMLGLIMPVAAEDSLFVKMTGPRPAVDAQADAFFALAESLRATSQNPHAGPTPDSIGAGAAADLQLQWTVPDGWSELASTSSVRRVTLRKDGDRPVDCWVSVLPGSFGGIAANVNMWRRSVGLPDLDEAAVAAMPTVAVLGGDATLVEAIGERQALLGLVAPSETHCVFVKLVGTVDDIQACREDFLAFCQSLRAES